MKLLQKCLLPLGGAVTGFLLARLYGLSGLPALAAALLFLPLFTVYKKKADLRKQENSRFHGLITYMEQLLYFFRRQPKIAAALREIENTMPQEMQPWVRASLNRLEAQDGGGNYRQALGLTEKEFPLRELRQLHHFLVMVEEIGGEHAAGTDLLLEQTRSRAMAEDRFAEEIERVRSKMTLCTGLSLLIGCVTVKLIPSSMSITGLPLYRWGTVAALAAYEAVFLLAQKACTLPLGRDPEGLTEERVRILKGRLQGNTTPKALIKGLLVPVICLIYCLWAGYRLAAVPAGLLCLWQLLLPYRQKKQALKLLQKEAGSRFPDWLRELSVHLQSQTVQTAIGDTLADASPLMKSYLKDLLRALDEDPVHIGPYRSFMAELGLQEVQDAMVLLYSINGMGRTQSEEQMNALLRRNRELYEQQEALRRQDAASAKGMLVALPMAVTILKLLADMCLTLLQFLSSMR